MSRRIQSCCVVIFLIFSYPFALDAKINGAVKVDKKTKPKPLKPLTEKDIQKANKKALEASRGKSIQKANQKVFRDQAKAIKKANEKAAKANKTLLKEHAKAVREAEKQARAEAKKKPQ